MKMNMVSALPFVAGCLCGAAAAAIAISGHVQVLHPLVMQTLVNDCLALKSTPFPKYPEGEPTLVYRVDCMR
jgi:hypothetical protein